MLDLQRNVSKIILKHLLQHYEYFYFLRAVRNSNFMQEHTTMYLLQELSSHMVKCIGLGFNNHFLHPDLHTFFSLFTKSNQFMLLQTLTFTQQNEHCDWLIFGHVARPNSNLSRPRYNITARDQCMTNQLKMV